MYLEYAARKCPTGKERANWLLSSFGRVTHLDGLRRSTKKRSGEGDGSLERHGAQSSTA